MKEPRISLDPNWYKKKSVSNYQCRILPIHYSIQGLQIFHQRKLVERMEKINTSGVLNFQKKWNDKFSKDQQLMEFMDDWRKTKARLLVLGITKPIKEKEQSQSESDESVVFDDEKKERAEVVNYIFSSDEDDEDFEDYGVISYSKEELLAFDASKFDPGDECNHAEKSKGSDRQLVQYLKALVFLIDAADDKQGLSEKLIKEAHKYLMEGLVAGDSNNEYNVGEGEYRNQSVSTTGHDYPDHTTIAAGIVEIVAQYEEMFTKYHDPFELACWLHLKVVSLHPFLEGNGRISRLLWCYSLMRDGLPFPVTPLSIPRIAQNPEYTQCVLADANSKSPRPENLISLTLTRVVETWKQFLHDLEEEKGGSVAFTDFSKWLGEEIRKMK